ncbi:SDR family NAD(P)-dependent oxidoreductase, partial [bacterium]|nr:SDR family NAD(P)-dependent oxidoreductase [bacterium]
VLANKNAEVIIAVRNEEKGQKAIQNIKNQTAEAKVSLMIMDLANLDSIKHFATAFLEKYEHLDLLINNAGVMIPPYSKTTDGFELQFGTNHLGHFALTGLLLKLLRNTKNSRIVNVSSAAHKFGKLNFDDLNWEKRKYSAMRAYGDSKIANLYFTYELKKRLGNNQPMVMAAHPGWTATDLQRHSGIFEIFNSIFAMKVEQGTLPTLRAAIDNLAKSGDYFGPDSWMEWRGYPIKVPSNPLSNDGQIAKKLWDISEELTGIKYGF